VFGRVCCVVLTLRFRAKGRPNSQIIVCLLTLEKNLCVRLVSTLFFFASATLSFGGVCEIASFSTD
jgi:hypothetical protein